MAPHEPDAMTTASAFFRRCNTGTATSRAPFQYPVLNAGCPQQASSSGYSTLCPRFSRICTMPMPTRGNIKSTKQGINSVTVMLFGHEDAYHDLNTNDLNTIFNVR